jgi:hypothetical protein
LQETEIRVVEDLEIEVRGKGEREECKQKAEGGKRKNKGGRMKDER